MSLNSAIAESQPGGVVVAPNLDWSTQKILSHSQFRLVPQFPNTYGQTISIGNGQSPSTINLPLDVFNFSESYLQYDIVIPAGGAGIDAVWPADIAGLGIQHIQHYGSSSNNYIVDVDNLSNYMKIIDKKETSINDLMSRDGSFLPDFGDITVAGVLTRKCNGLAMSNSNVDLNQIILSNGDATVPANAGTEKHPASLNYIEPQYFDYSGDNTAITLKVTFPLRLIKNTLFACNKNIYYNQISYLKLYFGPLQKTIYQTTQKDDPITGAADWGGAAINVQNLQLFLAIESNDQQRQMIINQVNSAGLTRYIPWVQSYRNSVAGATSQNISIQFDVGQGASLAKVIHSIFNVNESQGTAYDCSNSNRFGANLQKCTTYYTMLNGRRLQDVTLDCGNTTGLYTDYLNQKKFFKDSVIMNRDIFSYNWHHTDDFSQFGNQYDQNNNNELLSGLPMGPHATSNTWSFVGNFLTQAPVQYSFNHYTFAIFNRKLVITAGGGRLE